MLNGTKCDTAFSKVKTIENERKHSQSIESELVGEGLTSHSTLYRSFQRRALMLDSLTTK